MQPVIKADLNARYRIKKAKMGRPKKTKERRAYNNHGDSPVWQFRFPKTEKNQILADLVSIKSAEELEQRFGLKLDDDLEFKKGMKFIVENLLITLARRGRGKT